MSKPPEAPPLVVWFLTIILIGGVGVAVVGLWLAGVSLPGLAI